MHARPSRPFGPATCWALVATLAPACFLSRPDTPHVPDVLLITLGDVGAERISARPLSALQSLGAKGTTFTRAYVSSPDTTIAHADLLYGAPPTLHGVRGPAHEPPQDLVSLPEAFAAADRRVVVAAPTHSSGPSLRLPSVDPELAQHLATYDAPGFMWVHLDDAAWPCRGTLADAAQRCDGALNSVNTALSTLLEVFPPGPNRWVVVAGDGGLVLHDQAKRVGAVLDDAHLRVPLVVAGGDWPIATETRPVGIADVGATLHAAVHHAAQATDLRTDWPAGVWHEAGAGARWAGLKTLVGWTFEEGRYVEGAWAATYPLVGEGPTIASLPTHRTPRGPSARPEAEALGRARPPNRMNPVMWTAQVGAEGDPLPHAGTGDPRDAETALRHLALARAYIEAGLAEPGERELARFAALRRGAWAVRWLSVDIALSRADLATASDHLARLHAESDSPAAALRAAAHWLDLGLPALAVDASSSALRVADGAPGARRIAALAAARAGDTESAERLAAQLIIDGEGELILGELALSRGDAAAASASAHILLEQHPNDLDARLLLGRAAAAAGEGSRAAAELWMVLENNPVNVPARRALAQLALDDGVPDEAVRLLAPAAPLDDPDTTALLQAAHDALTKIRGPQVPKRPWK